LPACHAARRSPVHQQLSSPPGERLVLLWHNHFATSNDFGRTVQENGSGGTDHGTAGPILLAGRSGKSGLVGALPKLLEADPRHGDLRVVTDFRQVYAWVLESWLGLCAKAALGGSFTQLPLFRA
jgi:uncharacterized protein (DUF1501 family)